MQEFSFFILAYVLTWLLTHTKPKLISFETDKRCESKIFKKIVV